MWGMRRELGRRSKARATEARVACVTYQNILFWKTAARQNNRNGRQENHLLQSKNTKSPVLQGNRRDYWTTFDC